MELNKVKILTNVPAHKISTFGVGGLVSKAIEINNTKDFVNEIRALKIKKEPFSVISGGSNIVLPDENYTKTIIILKNNKINIHENGSVYVDAGVKLDYFVEKMILSGFSGIEFLSGIPGSVGGAIVGNAGAYGKSVSEFISYVEVFDGHKIYKLENSDLRFAYRESIFKEKELYITSCEFKFKKGNVKSMLNTRNKILTYRETKYKNDIKCPGSFFKNVLVKNLTDKQLKNINEKKIIEGKVPAGYLLQEVGACGLSYGGIHIAKYHGNLFINDGSGTYKDVIYLSNFLKEKVHKKFGIYLEEEVRFI